MMWIADTVARALARDRIEAPADLPSGVELRRSRLIPALGGWLSGMGRPAAAVTLGRTILVHPEVTLGDRLLRHELAHVDQWRRHPVTFPFRYIRSHIRHGYRQNPFETQARAAEADPAAREVDQPGAPQ